MSEQETPEPSVVTERCACGHEFDVHSWPEWGYGVFPGGDPRLFTPDEECCSPAEIEAHATACKEWDEGHTVDRGPGCATMGDGSVWDGTGFGIGSYMGGGGCESCDCKGFDEVVR